MGFESIVYGGKWQYERSFSETHGDIVEEEVQAEARGEKS